MCSVRQFSPNTKIMLLRLNVIGDPIFPTIVMTENSITVKVAIIELAHLSTRQPKMLKASVIDNVDCNP